MVNLNALQNISNPNLNNTILLSDSLLEETPSLFYTNVPYWLFPVTIIFFISLVWYIYRNPNWNLDIVQSSLIASFFQIVISFAIIRVGWSVSAVPLGFWGTIWIVLLLAMFYVKKRG